MQAPKVGGVTLLSSWGSRGRRLVTTIVEVAAPAERRASPPAQRGLHGGEVFWTIGQFPELDHLDAGQRAELLRRVPWWTYPQIILVALFGGAAGAGVLAAIAFEAVGARVAVAAFVVVGASAALWIYLVLLRRVRGAMRKEVAAGFLGRRPPFCFGCGYDLRVVGDERCPECGREILGGAEPDRDMPVP